MTNDLTFNKVFCTPKKSLLLGSDPLWEGFKPYQHAERKNPFLRELLKPFRGLCNLIYGLTNFIGHDWLCYLVIVSLAPLFLIFLVPPPLIYITPCAAICLAGGFKAVEDNYKPWPPRLHSLAHLFVGAFQIITTPLTWLVVIPIRLLATMACIKDEAPIRNKAPSKKPIHNRIPKYVRTSFFRTSFFMRTKSAEKLPLIINGEPGCTPRLTK